MDVNGLKWTIMDSYGPMDKIGSRVAQTLIDDRLDVFVGDV